MGRGYKSKRAIKKEYDARKNRLLEDMEITDEKRKQALDDAYEMYFQELCQREARRQMNILIGLSQDESVSASTKRQIAQYIIDRAHGKPKDRQMIEGEPIKIIDFVDSQPRLTATVKREEDDESTQSRGDV